MNYRVTYKVGNVASVGRGEVMKVLLGKPEGNRPLGRPRRRWEDNIKVHLQEVILWRHGQLAGYYECGNEPSGSIK
jgi:hypothetical protein